MNEGSCFFCIPELSGSNSSLVPSIVALPFAVNWPTDGVYCTVSMNGASATDSDLCFRSRMLTFKETCSCCGKATSWSQSLSPDRLVRNTFTFNSNRKVGCLGDLTLNGHPIRKAKYVLTPSLEPTCFRKPLCPSYFPGFQLSRALHNGSFPSPS